MPRSFLIKKKEKVPRWDREEELPVIPTPPPSRLEQLASIVTGAPIYYLPPGSPYSISPFTPLSISLPNGKSMFIMILVDNK